VGDEAWCMTVGRGCVFLSCPTVESLVHRIVAKVNEISCVSSNVPEVLFESRDLYF
jgi:hypothetical protein